MTMDWHTNHTVMDTGFEFLVLTFAVSTLLLGGVWLFNRAFCQISAAQRFATWQTTFIGILLLPLIFLLAPTIPLGIGSQSTQQPNIANSKSDWVAKNSDGSSHAPSFLLRLPDPIPLPISPAPSALEGTPGDASAVTMDVAQEYFHRKSNGITWLTPQSTVVIVWLSVALLLNIRLLVSIFQTDRILNTSLELFPQFSPTAFQVFMSPQVLIPVVYGFFRPRIVLPLEAEKWSDDQLQMSLAHEVAHIRRGDLRTQVLVSIVTRCLWFQPLAWIGQAAMGDLREQACDNEVLAQGTMSHRYAEVLLAMACRFSNKEIPGGLIVSMAEKPIERRLRNILNPTASRQRLTWSVRLVLFGICLAVTTMVATIRPFETPAAAVRDSTDDQDISEVKTVSQEEIGVTVTNLPHWLEGSVIDDEGKPVRNCEVHVRILTVPAAPSRTATTEHVLAMATTDENGFYRLKTEGIQSYDQRCNVVGYASATGHPDFQIHFRLEGPEYRLPEIKFRQGRKIQGILVAPLGGPKPINPSISLIGDGVGNRYQNWISHSIELGIDGSFQTWTPVTGRVELTAYSDNYAPKGIQIERDQTELGTIELNSGTEVIGKLLDQSGTPVAGVVLILERMMSNRINSMRDNALFNEPKRLVKTDEQGQFRFSPMSGPCSLYPSKNGWSATRGERLTSDRSLPLISPVLLELEKKTGQQQVDLKAGKTANLAGHVHWANGEPADNIKIHLGISNGQRVVTLSESLTGKDGFYKLKVPMVEDTICLSIWGRQGKDGKNYQAYPKNELGLHRREALQSFGRITEDISNVDWEFRVPIPPTEIAIASSTSMSNRKKTDADLTLQEIERSYFQQMTPGEVPDHKTLSNELLKFEEQYRGEHAAVVALRYLMTNGKSLKVRKSALKIVADHYLDHPFIDSCATPLITCNWGNGRLDTRVVDRIRSEHPDRNVRAACCLQELLFITEVLFTRDSMEQRDWNFDFARTNNPPVTEEQKQEFQQFQKRLKTLKSLDPDELRFKATELITSLKFDYPKMTVAQYGHAGVYHLGGTKINQGMLTFERSQSTDPKTYGHYVDLFEFQLNQLKIGSPVPELNAKGSDGKPIRFADYHGKLVLVYTTSPYWQGYLQQQNQLGELRKKFDGKLELVGIYHCDSNVDVLETLADRQIAWPVVLDGNDGPVFERWSRNGFGGVFLIDGNGIIRKELSLEEDLEAAIKSVLYN